MSINDKKPDALRVASEYSVTVFVCVVILSVTSCNISDKFASAQCLQYEGNAYTNMCIKDKFK